MWNVAESMAPVKLVLDERDMERPRRETVPGLEETSGLLERAERQLGR